MRVEPKTIGIAAVTHNRYTTRPHRLNDKLTVLFDCIRLGVSVVTSFRFSGLVFKVRV